MNFDITRLGRAEQVMGAGAIAFFIFLFFFHWYGISSNVSSISGIDLNKHSNGWDMFTNSRWIWLASIVAALGIPLARAAGRRIGGPVGPGVIVASLGGVSVLAIVYRILDHPSANASIGALHASLGIEIGIWLGLIAACVITYGGYLGMRAEGTSLRPGATRPMGGAGAP